MNRNATLAAIAVVAMAGVGPAVAGYSWWPKPTPTSAPEIDPASAMSALTLLAGGLAVLRGRRKRE